VSIYPLQNVQTGSSISVGWTFNGTNGTQPTQPVLFELGMTNTKTSAETILDDNVDLTRGGKRFMACVEGGSYRLFLRNPYNYSSSYYSNVFTVSQNTAKSE
ncbi:11569_t:CDS:1, partial [Gigaspora rosea]